MRHPHTCLNSATDVWHCESSSRRPDGERRYAAAGAETVMAQCCRFPALRNWSGAGRGGRGAAVKRTREGVCGHGWSESVAVLLEH